jgi:hypothetical protein
MATLLLLSVHTSALCPAGAASSRPESTLQSIPTASMLIRNTRYSFYRQEMTWQSAASYCNRQVCPRRPQRQCGAQP